MATTIVPLASLQRGLKLRALRSPAALYLCELTDKLPGTTIETNLHGLSLRVEPKAALTLLVG